MPKFSAYLPFTLLGKNKVRLRGSVLVPAQHNSTHTTISVIVVKFQYKTSYAV